MKIKFFNTWNLLKENYIYILTVFCIFAMITVCAYFITKSACEIRLHSEVAAISELSENLIKSNLKNVETNFSENFVYMDKILNKTEDLTRMRDYAEFNSYKQILSSRGQEPVYIYGIIRGKIFSNRDYPKLSIAGIESSVWYRKTIEAKGHLVRNIPYIDAAIGDGTNKLISWSREFFDKDGNSIGVINQAISYDSYIKLYSDISKFKSGYVALADSDNIILHHETEKFIGKHVLEVNKGFGDFLQNNNFSKRIISVKDGHPAYIFKKKIFNDWQLYVVIPLDSYYKDLRYAIFKAFSVCVISFFLLSSILVRLNIISKRASSENKAKSNFLAVMSHEIRTPLNAIIGLGQLEMENKNLPHHYKKTMEKILISGQNLLNIINDVLDLSKIESGKFEITPEEYDIPSLVNDVCVISRARLASKALEFKVSVSPSIPSRLYGDAQRIKQILNNFLSNAVKYTEEGFIEFSVSYTTMNNNPCIKFNVKDSGIGIRSEDIPRLFNAYNRLDTKKNRTIEGTGLGLSITKKIADLMNSVIEVKSIYGKGSEFSIYIPQTIIDNAPIGEEVVNNLQQMKYDAEKTVAHKSFVRTKMTGSSILIVDDVQMNLDVIKGLLEPYDLYIETATSGQQAINLIKNKHEYDLIFMDHMMPIMDGIEATRRIRNLDTAFAKNVPIVAFTANAMSGSDKMFLEKGFNDFISKPVDMRKLDACLKRWIKKSEKLEKDSDAAINTKILNHYIDFDEGIEQFGSMDEFRKMLLSFKKYTPELLQSMKEATGNDYIISIHSLKGCARTIFVKEIGDRAYELETAAKNGDWELVKSKNEALIKDTKRLIDAI